MSLPSTALHRNHLLAALAPGDFDRLSPLLKPVSLEFGEILEEAGRETEYVYFPEPGAASVLAGSADGAKIEVGVIGPEGMTGLAVVSGVDRAPHQVVVQIPFRASRIGADHLRRALRASRPLQAHFLRFAHVLTIQIAQTALCNSLCSVEQRLARWILMCHDRVDREDLPLTHELLSLRLGVRRASITTTVRSLERKGAIGSKRGSIAVRDRTVLLTLAGRAYGPPEAEYRRLFAGAVSTLPAPDQALFSRNGRL